MALQPAGRCRRPGALQPGRAGPASAGGAPLKKPGLHREPPAEGCLGWGEKLPAHAHGSGPAVGVLAPRGWVYPRWFGGPMRAGALRLRGWAAAVAVGHGTRDAQAEHSELCFGEERWCFWAFLLRNGEDARITGFFPN